MKALIVTARPEGADIRMTVYAPGHDQAYELSPTTAAGLVRDISAALAQMAVDNASNKGSSFETD